MAMAKESPIIQTRRSAWSAACVRLGWGFESFPCHCAWVISVFLAIAFLSGCEAKQQIPAERSTTARALFEETTKEFHNPSAEAKAPEKARLLSEAARRYEQLLKEYPEEQNLGAQALRGLGHVRLAQGQTNEAVKFYSAVAEKYPAQDWEVLQAWKAAADLLWDAGQHGEAKKYYAKIVARFGKNDGPQIFQTVVRGSKARLAE